MLYLTSGVLANSGTFLAGTSQFSLGASDCTFGLITAFTAYNYFNRHTLGRYLSWRWTASRTPWWWTYSTDNSWRTSTIGPMSRCLLVFRINHHIYLHQALPPQIHLRLAASLKRKGSSLRGWLVVHFGIIIIEVLKSTQINMIFSYKNSNNKRHLKPLLFSDFLVKPRVI